MGEVISSSVRPVVLRYDQANESVVEGLPVAPSLTQLNQRFELQTKGMSNLDNTIAQTFQDKTEQSNQLFQRMENPPVGSNETTIVSKERVTEIDNIVKKTEIEKLYLELVRLCEKELSKPREQQDIEKLTRLCLALAATGRQQSIRLDTEEGRKKVEKLNKIVKDLADSHNDMRSTAFTIAGAIISFAAAACSFSPFFVKASLAKTLSSASQPLSTTGQAVGGIGSVFDKQVQGTQTTLRYSQETTTRGIESRNKAKGEDQSTVHALIGQNTREAEAARHRAIEAALGG